MAKSEGSSGEAVEDGGVDLGVVLRIVSIGQRQDVQFLHEICPKNNRQPLVVGDVLQLCNKNPPGLLVELLIVPVRVEVAELLGQSVVFPHPDSVEHSQTRLLVGARIP